MKIQDQVKLYRGVERLIITEFNHNKWGDIVIFDEMLYKLGIQKDIITVGSRENDFNLDRDLLTKIRERLPDIYAKNDGYISDEKKSKSSSVVSLGYLSFYSDINSIIDLWRFYEFFCLFSIPGNSEPFRFLNTYNLNSFKDQKKIIVNKVTNVMVCKNDEDDEIFIDCLKENIFLFDLVREIVR